jgi:putative transposase
MIDRDASLPVTRQCQLLKVTRSTVYYRPAPMPEDTLAIMRALDEIHLELPFLGSRKLVSELAKRGLTVNRKRVKRLMGLMGMEAIYPKPKTSRPGVGAGHKIYPYLLGGMEITRVNQVWLADVTYIPMRAGFAYLVAVMDAYSRRILSWRLSNTADARFCVDALQEALELHGRPEIFNSDQGSTFTSLAFTGVLESHGVRISMDGKGRWIDNVFIERFWRSLKYEEVYLHGYDDLRQARSGIERYLRYYNHGRSHQSLNGSTPEQVYHHPTADTLVPAIVHRSAPLSAPLSS